MLEGLLFNALALAVMMALLPAMPTCGGILLE